MASSAGAVTAFAKPVIGTIVPAPACFAILGYILSPVSNALKKILNIPFTLDSYTQHALEGKTTSKAASYVSIKDGEGAVYYGAGIDSDIITSSIKALVSAINLMIRSQ